MFASLRSPRAVAPHTRTLRSSPTARRLYATTVTDLSALPQCGSKLHGFTLQRTKHVPALELSALHFRHDKTGADYLHVARDDKNNVFSIGFKTNPPDATGVPHILEHVTLCGSEKYPVRDPFFKLMPRSLQNFMNAMTSQDHTTYPFATTNSQDFKNLMSVYLDATLHPLLKRSDFVQEGWRIGPENPKTADEQSVKDLVFKGVVYNEMKGQVSDATYLKTGGIRFGYHASTSPHDILKAQEAFSMSGYAFDRNIPAMYELFHTILFGTDFDSPKAHGMIKELLRSGADGAVDAIASRGHSYASRHSNAGLNPAGRWAEQTSGLQQVKLITSLAAAEGDEVAMGELVQKLKALQGIAIQSLTTSFRAALVCGPDSSPTNETALHHFLTTTRSAAASSPTPSPRLPPPTSAPAPAYPTLSTNTFFPFPTYQVSYTALTLPTGPYTSPATAPLAILAQLLTHKHLHHEIREKGGAYGAGCSSNGLSGTMGMYSYRDPNPANSLEIMREAGMWASEREWSARELEEAKLSLFQAVDAPVSVDKEGLSRFLQGVDGEMEAKRREWLLGVDAGQVRQAAEGVAGRLERGEGCVTVLGAEGKVGMGVGEGWKVVSMGVAKAGAGGEAAGGG
ncbi:Mitochondrial presequence protease [Friedmanniomyces endolithicus]|nr:Mitochondrial presequence protease [Friedmanniomyces endolithicus]